MMINDQRSEDPAAIENHITDFYRKLYNQGRQVTTDEKTAALLRNMPELTEEMKQAALKPITVKELEQTLKQCADSVAGPDGIPYSYLKATWPTFGKKLIASWENSVITGTLPPSHNQSHLKLLPKAGKDLKEIKNWRPITLSNCDHKLITKTISKQLTKSLEGIISGNQTAYMKQRSIADNIRLMISANKAAKQDTRLKGLLIALDAKKAFDSVEHPYLKKILDKIGIGGFNKICDMLYKNQTVDININGKICEGYKITNGVKQGDSLSCILFILAMEPLLRNIDGNNSIESLRSEKLNLTWPKSLGYADDITVVCSNSITSVRETIKEYEKFTECSGLELNADKTEIFKICQTHQPQRYSFRYCGKNEMIETAEQIKINGVHIHVSPETTREINFTSILEKMKTQHSAWANRHLTVLGKILIHKTFGLSQLIYISRVIQWSEKQHKELRNEIYKFIWNTNLNQRKAPDRISREKMLTPIERGGFGMVDHEQIIEAMNCKQVMTNLEGSHPIRTHILNSLKNRSSKLNPILRINIDDPLANCIKLTGKLNHVALKQDLEILEQDSIAQTWLRAESLTEIIRSELKNSIELFMLNRQNFKTVNDLSNNPNKFNQFRMRLAALKYTRIMDAISINPTPAHNTNYLYINGKYKPINQCSSRTIRLNYNPKIEALNSKLDLIEEDLGPHFSQIAKIKNTRLKNLALRLHHNDIFTKAKMCTRGMIDNDVCDKCNRSEDLNHLLKDCWYSGRVWGRLIELYKKTDQRQINYDLNLDLILDTGNRLYSPKRLLHLEIIRRLTQKDRPNLLPWTILKQSVSHLLICEENFRHKHYYRSLLEALNS